MGVDLAFKPLTDLTAAELRKQKYAVHVTDDPIRAYMRDSVHLSQFGPFPHVCEAIAIATGCSTLGEVIDRQIFHNDPLSSWSVRLKEILKDIEYKKKIMRHNLRKKLDMARFTENNEWKKNRWVIISIWGGIRRQLGLLLAKTENGWIIHTEGLPCYVGPTLANSIQIAKAIEPDARVLFAFPYEKLVFSELISMYIARRDNWRKTCYVLYS